MTYQPPPDPFQYGPPPPAQPLGDPQYQAQSAQQYPPAQYSQPYPAQYAQPHHPQYGQPIAGYGYPPVIKARRVSEPVVGWLLLGSAVLMMVAAALPWATVLTLSVAGTVGGGKVTMFFGLLLAIFGLLIGLRQGLLWVPITACVLAILVVLIALGNMGNISSIAGSRNLTFLGKDAVSIGAGLWLTLVAGLAALTLSIIGMARRPVQNP